jgi:DNA polymerase-3 subunit alpha
MSLVLVFDCETTGLLPKKGGDTFPLIIQLSFALYDNASNSVIQLYDQYVRLPSGFALSPRVTEITGITRETIDKEGANIRSVLEAFYAAVIKADLLIAHNIDFDLAVLSMAASKVFEPLARELKRQQNVSDCTMKRGRDLCKISRTNSRGVYYKFPTLAELHTHLFGYVPKNLHDARTDVLCCLRCFLAMANIYNVGETEFSEWLALGG